MGGSDEARYSERESYHRDMAAAATNEAVRASHEAMAEAYRERRESIAGKSKTG